MMTLDQIEAKANELRNVKIGVFTDFHPLISEVFFLFDQIIKHLKAIEAKLDNNEN